MHPQMTRDDGDAFQSSRLNTIASCVHLTISIRAKNSVIARPGRDPWRASLALAWDENPFATYVL
jgi:hypothetical protein